MPEKTDVTTGYTITRSGRMYTGSKGVGSHNYVLLRGVENFDHKIHKRNTKFKMWVNTTSSACTIMQTSFPLLNIFIQQKSKAFKFKFVVTLCKMLKKKS